VDGRGIGSTTAAIGFRRPFECRRGLANPPSYNEPYETLQTAGGVRRGIRGKPEPTVVAWSTQPDVFSRDPASRKPARNLPDTAVEWRQVRRNVVARGRIVECWQRLASLGVRENGECGVPYKSHSNEWAGLLFARVSMRHNASSQDLGRVALELFDNSLATP